MQKLAIAAATGLSLLFFTADYTGAQPAAADRASADPVAVQPLRNNFCGALTPTGWTIIDQDDRGAAYRVASEGRKMIASYGVIGISSAQAAGYFGPQFRRPPCSRNISRRSFRAKPSSPRRAAPSTE